MSPCCPWAISVGIAFVAQIAENFMVGAVGGGTQNGGLRQGSFDRGFHPDGATRSLTGERRKCSSERFHR